MLDTIAWEFDRARQEMLVKFAELVRVHPEEAQIEVAATADAFKGLLILGGVVDA